MARGQTQRTPELVAEAQRLRAGGLKWREIGERLGVSLKAAHEWATDPDGSLRDARKARYRGKCVDCGGPTDGSDPRAPSLRCRECSRRHQHADRLWTPEAIVCAIQQWADEHGGIPPAAQEWNAGYMSKRAQATKLAEFHRGGYPSVTTVVNEFGSWNAGIRAAGFEPRARSERRLHALSVAVIEHYGEASAAEIAADFGVSQELVFQTAHRLRKAGHPVAYRIAKAGAR